jgi:hypothetical protein
MPDLDPIVYSVSSGYDNDPLACSWTRSGRRIWMYPEARARYEAKHPGVAEWQTQYDAMLQRILED